MEQNNKSSTAIILFVVIVIIIVGVVVWMRNSSQAGQAGTQTGTTTTTITTSTTTSSGATVTTTSATTTLPGAPAGFDRSVSDGTISLEFPSSQFALATDPSQITTKSYIPPCDQGFDYCLYYDGTAYAGTNFESAGLAVQPRTDLITQTQCLTTQPSGYTGLVSNQQPTVTLPNGDGSYTVSVFSPVGDAAAGHFANGAVYRMAYQPGTAVINSGPHNSGSSAGFACYEFDTQVGQTDFYNYPAGAINEFTPADQTALFAQLTQILNTLSLPSGQSVLFPAAATTSSR